MAEDVRVQPDWPRARAATPGSATGGRNLRLPGCGQSLELGDDKSPNRPGRCGPQMAAHTGEEDSHERLYGDWRFWDGHWAEGKVQSH